MQMEVEAAIKELDAKLNPKEDTDKPVPVPFYRSKKFMISSAVLILLLAGGVPTVKILADQAEVKQKEQQEATRLADIKAAEEAEAAKAAALKQQEEQEKQKAAEAAKLDAEERKSLLKPSRRKLKQRKRRRTQGVTGQVRQTGEI
ncbi:hypothetical protein Q0F98_31915 [Paenibacillus amylolyticus]|nr:hypothetical protein Q0F98_31915 [Paenibacillus amylolyticus]